MKKILSCLMILALTVSSPCMALEMPDNFSSAPADETAQEAASPDVSETEAETEGSGKVTGAASAADEAEAEAAADEAAAEASETEAEKAEMKEPEEENTETEEEPAKAEEKADAEEETAGEQPSAEEEEPQFHSAEFTVYFGDLSGEDTIELACWSDAPDLPYIEMRDLIDLLVDYYSYILGDEGYGLSMTWDDHVVSVDRENGYSMLIDFDEGTVSFEDYDAFIHSSSETQLLDLVSTTGFDEEGNASLFQRNSDELFDRYGAELNISLTDYGIDVFYSTTDSLYYLPLQFAGDFLFSITGFNLYFNQEAVYVANMACFYDEDAEELTEMGEAYYSAETGLKSERMADYSYRELCLALDYLYGLQGTHGIAGFDKLFYEIGFQEDLKSTDPEVSDYALQNFINYYLDDLHSGLNAYSYLHGYKEEGQDVGYSSRSFNVLMELYQNTRNAAPVEIENYQEVGNTAYITFDSFRMIRESEDYYQLEEDEVFDTVSLMIYAHSQITRPGSPIENVVIDLSNNTGGAVDAAAYVMCWFLGEGNLSIKNMMTGASSTSVYQADINLDREFDESDSVADRRLFCLISPVSFSCGNLLPAFFKASHKVTLLGDTSGGGSCVVLNLSTAYGTVFQISSPYQISFVKNGSFYDIDQGVEPDYIIKNPDHLYDREALTDYINQLF